MPQSWWGFGLWRSAETPFQTDGDPTGCTGHVPHAVTLHRAGTAHGPVLGHPDKGKSILPANLPKFTLFVDTYPKQVKLKLKDE